MCNIILLIVLIILSLICIIFLISIIRDLFQIKILLKERIYKLDQLSEIVEKINKTN